MLFRSVTVSVLVVISVDVSFIGFLGTGGRFCLHCNVDGFRGTNGFVVIAVWLL